MTNRARTAPPVHWSSFSWTTRGDYPLPRRADLEDAAIPVGWLESARLTLTRSGRGTKWHVVTATTSWDRCQHVDRNTTGEEIALLDAAAHDLCRRCAGLLWHQLTPRVQDYYRLVIHLVRAHHWVDSLVTTAPTMDWLTYSRWASSSPFTRDQPWRDALTRLTGRGAPALRLELAGIWRTLGERVDQALARGATAAGAPGLVVHAAHARATLAADPTIQRQAVWIATVAGDRNQIHGMFDVWRLAAGAWENATVAGQPLDKARQAMLDAVESHYRSARVRDMALMPDKATLSPNGFCGPAHWADAEFAVLRRSLVGEWADALEHSLMSAELTAHSGTPKLLLLLNSWPPVLDNDADLAYLVQYPEILRFRVDRTLARPSYPSSWGPGRRSDEVAVVLRVPEFAAAHAATAARSRLVKVVDSPGGGDSSLAVVRAAVTMARASAAYLDQDAATDPGTDPSDLVVRERRSQRQNAGYHLQYLRHRADDQQPSRNELALWWCNGHLGWVCDNDGDNREDRMPFELGTTTGLRSLLDHAGHGERPVTVTLEAGPHGDTRLTRLRGILVDVTDTQILVTTDDRDLTITVPMHRVVAVHAEA